METFFEASKEFSLEVISEEIMYMSLSCYQNARKIIIE
jgi:hypothetical protein